MWKKTSSMDPTPATRTDIPSKPQQSHSATSIGGGARIGTSLTVKGELQGQEDLVIEGSVQGKINLRQASVTIGEKGRVEADIEAANIRVAGEVKGNLTGSETVVLLHSGRVEGDIKAKSVTLENGCRFKGSIDMESQSRTRPVKEDQGVTMASVGAAGRA